MPLEGSPSTYSREIETQFNKKGRRAFSHRALCWLSSVQVVPSHENLFRQHECQNHCWCYALTSAKSNPKKSASMSRSSLLLEVRCFLCIKVSRCNSNLGIRMSGTHLSVVRAPSAANDHCIFTLRICAKGAESHDFQLSQHHEDIYHNWLQSGSPWCSQFYSGTSFL